jgi:hypothetical protein
MRILLTDSGLGGLSVCADISQKVKTLSNLSFNKLEIKYVNAIPKTHGGYNLMVIHYQQFIQRLITPKLLQFPLRGSYRLGWIYWLIAIIKSMKQES